MVYLIGPLMGDATRRCFVSLTQPPKSSYAPLCKYLLLCTARLRGKKFTGACKKGEEEPGKLEKGKHLPPRLVNSEDSEALRTALPLPIVPCTYYWSDWIRSC